MSNYMYVASTRNQISDLTYFHLMMIHMLCQASSLQENEDDTKVVSVVVMIGSSLGSVSLFGI